VSAGPYRQEPSGPRYVCIVCYAHASVTQGLCPSCEVDLLVVENPEVRAELRAEAERRMQKRLYAESFGLSLLGFVATVPILLGAGQLLYLASALAVGWITTQIYTRVRPGSALGLYAARRHRLVRELAGQRPQAALPPPGDRVQESDPEELPLEATLRWLGIRLDERGRSSQEKK